MGEKRSVHGSGVARRRRRGVCGAACYSDVLNVEVVRHRAALSQRPSEGHAAAQPSPLLNTALGTTSDRPRERLSGGDVQCSGMSPYAAGPACFKQRLRQRRHRCISYTVGSLYFETGRRKSRLLDRFANQLGRVGEKLLALAAPGRRSSPKCNAGQPHDSLRAGPGPRRPIFAH